MLICNWIAPSKPVCFLLMLFAVYFVVVVFVVVIIVSVVFVFLWMLCSSVVRLN